MNKLSSSVRKEFLVLIRDIYGLLLLFFMPVLLLVVVTLAQENGIRSSGNAKADLLFISRSGSAFPDSLEKTLRESGFFSIIRTTGNGPLNELQAIAEIRKGNFPLGLMIAENDTAIRLWVDPALQLSYRESLISSVTWLVKSTQARMAMHKILSGLYPGNEKLLNGLILDSLNKMPTVKEVYAIRETATIKPTIIQNNIPGFILFAMFFIVIPLSGSIITEKMEGSFLRLKTLPITTSLVLLPKIVIYLLVCLLQFCMMLAVGIWVFPALFGFPPLQLGHQYFAIFIATLASGLAAIGFGLLVGAGSQSHSQSALFGSIMVVILGAISGTFLPMYLLPQGIKYMSMFSPVRWGIDNYIKLFVREGTLFGILPNLFLLLSFFVFAMTISIAIFARQK